MRAPIVHFALFHELELCGVGDLSTPMFDCGDEEFIPLEDLCNGFDDCSFSTSPGSDEQAVICDSK